MVFSMGHHHHEPASSSAAPIKPPNNNSHHAHHHHHKHHLSVENLLGALSFEHLSPFYRKKKLTTHLTAAASSNSDGSHNSKAVGAASLPKAPDFFTTSSSRSTDNNKNHHRKSRKKLLPTPILSPSVAHRGKARRQKQQQNEQEEKNDDDVNNNELIVTTILYGTPDPDGNVEVFFDAAEFGDGPDQNEFAAQFQRDSVLVRNDDCSIPAVQSIRGGAANVPTTNQEQQQNYYSPPPPPPPPQQLPLRFLRAGKGDPVEGLKRYEATLQWRKEHGIDTILREPSPHYQLIHENYRSYIHMRGRNNEPVYYEQPPRTNLKALAKGGVTVPSLLRHYAAVTEFQWQVVERDDLARSITVIDLQGMRMTDFVGDVVDFSKKAAHFCGQHFPERAGFVYLINVPAWFSWIWNIVQPWLDPVTIEKIQMIKLGNDGELKEKLLQRIPSENLPAEYGGTCPIPLGQSPEQEHWAALMRHNNELAEHNRQAAAANNNSHDDATAAAVCSPAPPCGGVAGGCQFCSWVPARSY